MRTKNRQRRDAKRRGRDALATAAHRRAVQRIWAVAVCVAAPAKRVVVGATSNTSAAAPPSTRPVTSSVDTGLTPGMSYTFKIAARNSYGAGPQSDASNAVVPT